MSSYCCHSLKGYYHPFAEGYEIVSKVFSLCIEVQQAVTRLTWSACVDPERSVNRRLRCRKLFRNNLSKHLTFVVASATMSCVPKNTKRHVLEELEMNEGLNLIGSWVMVGGLDGLSSTPTAHCAWSVRPEMQGRVISQVGDRVKVRFADGTISSWGIDGVVEMHPDLEVCG